MNPTSIVLKGGLTARHFSIIQFLVLEDGSNQEAVDKFDLDMKELEALRKHPLWMKQERGLVKERKVDLAVASIEDLYDEAIGVLRQGLNAVRYLPSGHKVDDTRTRLVAAIKCIDLMLDTLNDKSNSDKPLDLYIPPWMKKEFKKKQVNAKT